MNRSRRASAVRTAGALTACLGAAWLATALLDLNSGVLVYATALAFGAADGRWWLAIAPIVIGAVVVLGSAAADLLGAGCALCSDGDRGLVSGSVMFLGALVLPVCALLAAGALLHQVVAGRRFGRDARSG